MRSYLSVFNKEAALPFREYLACLHSLSPIINGSITMYDAARHDQEKRQATRLGGALPDFFIIIFFPVHQTTIGL